MSVGNISTPTGLEVVANIAHHQHKPRKQCLWDAVGNDVYLRTTYNYLPDFTEDIVPF